MALPTHILLTYGYLLLFAWVLVEQFGIPLPATPVLLAAGALSAEAQISFPLALLAGLAGSLMADSSWFLIGRTLRPPCAASPLQAVAGADHLRPPHPGLVRPPSRTLRSSFAKFVPGLATLAAPVAGAERHEPRQLSLLRRHRRHRCGWARC